VEPWVEGLGPPAEPLLETECALLDLFVGVWAAAAEAGQPGAQAARGFAAALQHALVAGRLCIVLEDVVLSL